MSAAWTVVARFTSVDEAAAARSALDAAGIDAYLSDEDVANALKLMVRDHDVERSLQVIHRVAAGYESASGATSCPDCRSPLRAIPRFRIFLLLAVLFLGVGAIAGETMLSLTALVAVAAGVVMMPSHRCAACGSRSSPLAGRDSQLRLPDVRDMVDAPCPRCDALEVHPVPRWWFGWKRRCDACGRVVR